MEFLKNSFALELKEVKKELALEIKENEGTLQIFKKEF